MSTSAQECPAIGTPQGPSRALCACLGGWVGGFGVRACLRACSVRLLGCKWVGVLRVFLRVSWWMGGWLGVGMPVGTYLWV